MDNIIAIKGPFGIHINDGIIKEYKIRCLITKDSGLEGGMEEKIESGKWELSTGYFHWIFVVEGKRGEGKGTEGEGGGESFPLQLQGLML